MPVDILVPPLGESVLEATVARWLKHEGEPVMAGETVVELETDKVNLEVGAQGSGVLSRITHREGDDVKIGDVLGVIDEQAQPSVPATAAPASVTQAQAATPEQTPSAGESNPFMRVFEDQSKPTPVARRLAEEHQVDLSKVPASGADGRITKQDVEGFMRREQEGGTPQAGAREQAEPTAPAATPRAEAQSRTVRSDQRIAQTPSADSTRSLADREERVRMSRRRRTIALRLVEAQHTAAMLTTFNELDMSKVVDIRNRRRESFKEEHGVSLGFMSFFVKATIGALKAFPPLNAEIQGEELVLKHYYDIGIAVGATEGLVVPVLRDAERMSFAQIEQHIKDFAQRAADNTLSIEDLRGGTFTITNGGVFGSLLSTPILNPPQVAILGLHKVEQRPIALNGEVVIRPMMYVALSYDHRIVDGREAVQFLVKVKQLIEDPESLLIEG